jgi:DNA-directed RNA polymerase subunit RPC12/RpoP
MKKVFKKVSVVCTDCKTSFVLRVDSIKHLVLCPNCKQSDFLSFGN